MSYDPKQVASAMVGGRWSVLARTGLDLASVGTWDPGLVRGPRVLVPVDVQALVVGGAGGEACVRLPGPLTPGGPTDLTPPPPFDPGTPRAPGVHLHWALPDALLRAQLRDTEAATAGAGLTMRALPDRWAVLRLLAPEKGTRVHVTGWVVSPRRRRWCRWRTTRARCRRRRSRRTSSWRPRRSPAPPGGSLTWTGSYDDAFARFAVHDPLTDLAADAELGGALPGGPHAGVATYVVVGWWSQPGLDPLDGVRTEGGLTELLAALGWVQPPRAATASPPSGFVASKIADLGLPLALRDDDAGGLAGVRAKGLLGADTARVRYAPRGAGPTASTLLHGAVLSVPVDGRADPGLDLRPAPERVQVAFGRTLEELTAAITAPALADGTDTADVERMLAAFGTGLLRRLGQPDGAADIDAHRHASGFAARAAAGEPAVVDRVRTRVAGVPGRPSRPHSPKQTGTKAGTVVFELSKVQTTLRLVEDQAETIKSITAKFQTVAEVAAITAGTNLRAASPDASRADTAAQRRSAGGTGAAATDDEGRLVERPVPPYSVPVDPAVALAGVGRPLRHGGDGRFRADGMLLVRRVGDVGQEYAGVLPGSAVLPALGSGAVPEEALPIAREAALLSLSWLRWLTQRVTERTPMPARPVLGRLAAELALRFDASGAYTTGISLEALRTGPVGRIGARGDDDVRAVLVDEALRAHSMLDGVEPSPVAITSWAQPWVPLWLEWQVTVDTLDPDAAGEPMDGWQLGAVDLDPRDEVAPTAVRTVVASARTPLTDSPAAGLSDALLRWLREEDERDAEGIGELDEERERRLADLARHVASLDLAAANLDGVRDTLLGVPDAAVRTRGADGQPVPPTPTALPLLFVAGLVRLTRARVVDAFGRTLELDVDAARVPAADTPADTEAGPAAGAVLVQRPRLTAPTRVRLALVGAATASASAAVPARVDEIEPGEQVSPVAGFLLPDHVDESAELFAADGTPLGELLTAPLGRGVVWEPAPGRPLPQDAAPGAGLTPEQALLGRFAAGVITAEAQARAGAEDAARRATAAGEELPPPLEESALAALLRAVDTTLWTVDPVSGVGTSAPGGIVGRPVALVRCVLSLDVADDLGR
jgi:hypothetical protein